MFLRTIFAALLGCALLLAPIASTAADRGPSTPEERKQALEYIHDFEANPLGPHAVEEREWVLRWIIEVPDIHVSVCTILDKLPKGDKKDASTVFIAETFSQTAFLIQNPDKQDDRLAEYQAGVEGALRVYDFSTACAIFLDTLMRESIHSSTAMYLLQNRCKSSKGRIGKWQPRKQPRRPPRRRPRRRPQRRSSGTSNGRQQQKATPGGRQASPSVFLGRITLIHAARTQGRKNVTRRRWIAEHWDEATATSPARRPNT
jgi:hypothetical protein